MSNRGRWAISPTEACQAHLLVAERLNPEGVLLAQCGQVLPVTAVRATIQPTVVPTCPVYAQILQELFSGRSLAFPSQAVTAAGDRPVLPVPPPRFPHDAPAGRWLSDAPGGQPVPPDEGSSDNSRDGGGQQRWARCPADRLLHLLTPPQTSAVTVRDEAEALCGRVIPPEVTQLRALEGPARTVCQVCLDAAGSAR